MHDYHHNPVAARGEEDPGWALRKGFYTHVQFDVLLCQLSTRSSSITVLLCCAQMLNRDGTEAALGPGIFLEGSDKKHWKCCLALCPLPLRLEQAQRGEKLLGSLGTPVPPGEKSSQCAFLPKIREFLRKKEKKRIWSQLFLY